MAVGGKGQTGQRPFRREKLSCWQLKPLRFQDLSLRGRRKEGREGHIERETLFVWGQQRESLRGRKPKRARGLDPD